MDEETLTEKRKWLHSQLNGAIAFAALTTFFVSSRWISLGFTSWRKKNRISFSLWEDTLILVPLIAYLALCSRAIGMNLCFNRDSAN